MGKLASKICGSNKKPDKVERTEPIPMNSPESLPDLPHELAEDETIVPDNKDGYFSREDIVAIIQKYPEYREWEKLSKHPSSEPKPKARKIKWKEAEEIGHGSFGRVVLGLNLNTGEIMAVKQVHLGGMNLQLIQDKINALEAELDLLTEFSHKNIVRYIGTTRNKESFNIFLEYVAGGTIASLVAKYGPFNETIIKIYIKQILEGLEYLHARNIIHRDIKGANVLVDNTGVCKLADFGSAKRIKNLLEGEALHSLKGTANWMAPEVIMQKDLGRFADIWSIGCVILEMATGKPPWSGTNQMATMFQIAKTKTPPPYPPNISSDCSEFLDLCFKINPKERGNVTLLLKHKYLKDVENLSNEEQSQLLKQAKSPLKQVMSPQQAQMRMSLDKLIISGTNGSVRVGSLKEVIASSGNVTEEYKKSPNLERERLTRQALLSQTKKTLEQKGELNIFGLLAQKSNQEENKPVLEQKNPAPDQNREQKVELLSQKPEEKEKIGEEEKGGEGGEGGQRSEGKTIEKQRTQDKNEESSENHPSPQEHVQDEHIKQADTLKPILKEETGTTSETKEILSQNDSQFRRSNYKHVSDAETICIENVDEAETVQVRNRTILLHHRNDGSAGGEQILSKNSGYQYSGNVRLETDGDFEPGQKQSKQKGFQRDGKVRAQSYFHDASSNFGGASKKQSKGQMNGIHGIPKPKAFGFEKGSSIKNDANATPEHHRSQFAQEQNKEFFDGVQQNEFNEDFSLGAEDGKVEES